MNRVMERILESQQENRNETCAELVEEPVNGQDGGSTTFLALFIVASSWVLVTTSAFTVLHRTWLYQWQGMQKRQLRTRWVLAMGCILMFMAALLPGYKKLDCAFLLIVVLLALPWLSSPLLAQLMDFAALVTRQRFAGEDTETLLENLAKQRKKQNRKDEADAQDPGRVKRGPYADKLRGTTRDLESQSTGHSSTVDPNSEGWWMRSLGIRALLTYMDHFGRYLAFKGTLNTELTLNQQQRYNRSSSSFSFSLTVLLSVPFVAAIVALYLVDERFSQHCSGCIIGAINVEAIIPGTLLIVGFLFASLVKLHKEYDPLGLLKEVKWAFAITLPVFFVPFVLVQVAPETLNPQPWLALTPLTLHWMMVCYPMYKQYKEERSARLASVASSGSDKQRIKLVDVLLDDKAHKLYKQFCISEFSVENLLFWEQVLRWKKQRRDAVETGGDAMKAQVNAEIINETFVAENASLPINVSFTQQQNTEKQFLDQKKRILGDRAKQAAGQSKKLGSMVVSADLQGLGTATHSKTAIGNAAANEGLTGTNTTTTATTTTTTAAATAAATTTTTAATEGSGSTDSQTGTVGASSEPTSVRQGFVSISLIPNQESMEKDDQNRKEQEGVDTRTTETSRDELIIRSDVFDECLLEIYRLQSRDTFVRFLKSPLYRNWSGRGKFEEDVAQKHRRLDADIETGKCEETSTESGDNKSTEFSGRSLNGTNIRHVGSTEDQEDPIIAKLRGRDG